MVEVFYWCRHEDDNQFVADSLTELASLLARPPTKIIIDPKPLPSGFEAKLVPHFQGAEVFGSIVAYIDMRATSVFTGSELFGITDRNPGCRITPSLLIYDDQHSQLAKACQRDNPKAFWGGAIGCLAIFWEPNKYLLWHEVLHTLCVDDCYEMNGGTPQHKQSCERKEKCIMQYAPTQEEVGPWPFLCTANVNAIVNYCKGK